MKVVFACGGTGGHINPALTLARAIRSGEKNAKILFVGADSGMETTLVPREGFALKTVAVRNLRHSLRPSALLWNARTLAIMSGALRGTKNILKDFQPDIVVGTGGFACFPTLYAARRLGIPGLLHESNAIPGIVTKLLESRVERVMVGFKDAGAGYRHPEKLVYTGTPVRSEFLFADRAAARASLGLDGRPVLVSVFGSVGARDMNAMLVGFMRTLPEKSSFQLVHVTGKAGWAAMRAALDGQGIAYGQGTSIRLLEYAYDMPALMAAADLLLCRAGASTIGELTAAGRPAILIPSPNVVADHQMNNARALEATGCVVVLNQKELDERRLFDEATSLLHNSAKLDKMSQALRASAVPDAAERIVRLIRQFALAR